MKHVLLIMILLAGFLRISAQEDNLENNAKLNLKFKKQLFVAGIAGFGEKSDIFSAGIQAAKLIDVTFQNKNVVTFNIDLAAIQVRKQYHSDNFRPGFYLSGSFVKNIYSVDGYVFSATNRTILDYGRNQFTSDGFVQDNASHFEISNLTGISVHKILLKKQRIKIIASSGLYVSNVEKPRLGYIVSFFKSINSIIVIIKADNTSSIGHKLSIGILIRLN